MHAIDIGLALLTVATSHVKFSVLAHLLRAGQTLQGSYDVATAPTVEHHVEGIHLLYAIGLTEGKRAAGDHYLIDGGCVLMQSDGHWLLIFT